MSLHAAGRIDEAKAFADNRRGRVLPVAEEAEVRLGIAGMWLVSPDAETRSTPRGTAGDSAFVILPRFSVEDLCWRD
jgi:hypothetical protein